MEKWIAMEVSDSVVNLRQTIQERVKAEWGWNLEESSSPEAKQIRSLLHPYLIQARKGESVNIDIVWKEIESKIHGG